jgi:hypothetical protein
MDWYRVRYRWTSNHESVGDEAEGPAFTVTQVEVCAEDSEDVNEASPYGQYSVLAGEADAGFARTRSRTR